MDEARVIPLHGDGDGSVARRRGTGRRPARELAADASIYPFSGTEQLEPEPVASVDVDIVRAWEHRVAGALAFLRRRVAGDYEVDEFGFDADLTENVVIPLLKPLYDRWFRVEVNGVDNIPADGGALLVANHAGGLWALDAAMTAVAVSEEHPARRHLRMLGADLVFRAPGVGSLARKTGATLACNPDAERLLAADELVGVWPEGFKGIGKPFSQRYTLQRFGRGGFVHAALRTGKPIIPVSVVGSEEIHPVLANAKTLARILNLPYFPITPTFPWLGPLGLVPLPSKWYIEFGAPIETAEYSTESVDDPVLLFDLTDRVRETIQSTLFRLLVQRRSVWR
jgi:1-acyl-sn-glycerol-3-phosphate acyltransferase